MYILLCKRDENTISAETLLTAKGRRLHAIPPRGDGAVNPDAFATTR